MGTKFFLPYAIDKEMAEEGFKWIRGYIAKRVGPTTTMGYFKLSYRSGGSERHARVGEQHPENGETVFAILRADKPHGPFYVCTPNWGVWHGTPIVVTESQTTRARPFDP